MEDNAIDVPTEWLYKGKRTRKSRPIGGADSATAAIKRSSVSVTKRNRSSSISNAALRNNSPPTQIKETTTAKSNTSNSGIKTPLRRSISLNEKHSNTNNTLTQHKKTSILGSLFGRRNSTSSGSTASATVPARSAPAAAAATMSSSHSTPSSNTATIAAPVGKPVVTPSTPTKTDLVSVSLKRVTFAVDSFDSDPPQQLPSRNPKKGNVLIPDDMITGVMPISMGISNTAQTIGGASSTPIYTKDSKEYKVALENYKKSLKESEKHQQEAHYAAQRIAHEVSNFRTTTMTAAAPVQGTRPALSQDPIASSSMASLVEIDKPIHMHEHHFESSMDSTKNPEMTLDVVYTRCCHLREILPIPSTLRQVKGKTAPLQTLKFLNPKPTLIDILSFCDFISVVPIHTIIFDNVSLNPTMFKTLICSLVNSKVIERLGLRNVVIDSSGWQLLCKFLQSNKSLIRLDVSQTKLKTDLLPTLYRHAMDWPIFIDILSKRQLGSVPMEELLLNGLKLNQMPVPLFQKFLDAFGHIRTSKDRTPPIRLGLATSELTIDHLKVLLNWMSTYKVQGVDLSFNDFSDLVRPMVSKLSSLNYDHLQYFTLNSTNISSPYDAALILKNLSKFPNLKFLDMSNLPQIFPDVLPFLHKYLPRFPALKRVHFDNNQLTIKDVSLLSNILVKCKTLSHISLVSQNIPSISALASEANDETTDQDMTKGKLFAQNTLSVTLYSLVSDSPNLVSLDIDYDKITEEIQSRIALTLMRNMNRIMDSDFKLDELSSQDDLLFDGSLLSETAERVLEGLNNKPLQEQTLDSTKKYLLHKYVEKLLNVRHNVQKTIDELFEKRRTGNMPLQEKENLLRLLLVEKNLTNILEVFSKIPDLSDILQQSLPPLKHVDSESMLAESTHHTSSSSSTSSGLSAAAAATLSSRPHLMATESGRIIDLSTGKPLLSKSSSNTSLFGKKQEEEEGELHKWGFYVQQQKQLYPDNEGLSSPQGNNNSGAGSRPPVSSPKKLVNGTGHVTPSPPAIGTPVAATNNGTPPPVRIIPKIPSGAELREAIIKAKGINAIEELIENVNQNNGVGLEKIYGRQFDFDSDNYSAHNQHTSKASSPLSPSIIPGTTTPLSTLSSTSRGTTPVLQNVHTGNFSIEENAIEDDEVQEEVAEQRYDQLINNLSEERASKNPSATA